MAKIKNVKVLQSNVLNNANELFTKEALDELYKQCNKKKIPLTFNFGKSIGKATDCKVKGNDLVFDLHINKKTFPFIKKLLYMEGFIRAKSISRKEIDDIELTGISLCKQ